MHVNMVRASFLGIARCFELSACDYDGTIGNNSHIMSFILQTIKKAFI